MGVERTLAEDIHDWEDCETLIIDKLYPELEMRLRKVKPDLHIARQGVKLKFQDFQQTTQEHVFPVLNRQDLLEVARQAWRERREGRGVRLVGLHVTLLDPQLERQLALPLGIKSRQVAGFVKRAAYARSGIAFSSEVSSFQYRPTLSICTCSSGE